MEKKREIMKCVGHQQASQLLHNKFIVVLGDSIQRSVYKDLVLLLQKEKYLTLKQLKTKGEMSFEQDCLVEGGCLSQMHNRTEYREVRQFHSAHHLVRFYFLTRIYSHYMQSVLEDFRHGLKPDVVIVNSCVWDISRWSDGLEEESCARDLLQFPAVCQLRYNSSWIDDYKEDLYRFFDELSGILPEDTLVIWSLTMPLSERIKGGFLVPEIEYKAPQLRYDVIEANFYSGTLADAYGMDVLDLHFQFRFSLHHRTKDGVHWNALAHRRITSLLLHHTAQAWGVIMPCPMTAVESHPRKRNYNGYRKEFFSDSLPFSYLSFEDNSPKLPTYRHEAAGAYRPSLPPQSHLPVHKHINKHEQVGNGFNYRPPHHFQPYSEHHHQYVMRSRHSRRHYAPYTHHRPNPYTRTANYY
ncbi:PC-esterase domain-containing protein 1A-like isoform X2 [Xiphias gladius]|uniref:PC-esterase domain-containing protein 1A-like isoform X2 n=1 Tax=Xiphias gladius TaxID=8245 RepID=UPI001A97E8CF|nr:PC-esterase domain-containing protein 1A-like isoform X2 [Xiphias gladius]